MYYPVGWPRVLRLPPYDDSVRETEIKEVVCNRDKILAAILTSEALQIWYIKVRCKQASLLAGSALIEPPSLCLSPSSLASPS